MVIILQMKGSEAACLGTYGESIGVSKVRRVTIRRSSEVSEAVKSMMAEVLHPLSAVSDMIDMGVEADDDVRYATLRGDFDNRMKSVARAFFNGSQSVVFGMDMRVRVVRSDGTLGPWVQLGYAKWKDKEE